MAIQETIAFIGGAGQNCPVLMEKLVKGNLRLLFLYKEEEEINSFIENLKWGQCQKAEVEVAQCLKDSCWEADIIAFVDPGEIQPEVLEKMKEVATQKIVLLIATEQVQKAETFQCRLENLQDILPHSKVVKARVDSERMKVEVSGQDMEAGESVAAVFAKAGYTPEEVNVLKI